MLTINDNNLIVNYIKQILTSFNLPNFKIYKEGMHTTIGQLYLKDNQIVQCTDKGFYILFRDYIAGQRYLNYTKTFNNTSLIYDTATHEYLGEYLRFLRDYKNLDLMSLYNCYSRNYLKNITTKVPYDFDANTTTKTVSLRYLTIDTTNQLYRYILIPVKLGKKYTIALSTSDVEMFCCFKGKGYYNCPTQKITYTNQTDTTIKSSEYINTLLNETYLYKSNTSFNKPFIYDKLVFTNDSLVDLDYIEKHEGDLKLVLRVPEACSNSIVVIEGEYLNTNDFYFEKVNSEYDINQLRRNKSTLNFENKNENIYSEEHFKRQLQLLAMQTNETYLVADKLIAYLVNLPITNVDDISQNIKRLQKRLVALWKESYVQETQGQQKIDRHPLGIQFVEKYGVWNNYYQALLYSMSCKYGLIDTKQDILGYVDKDVETKLGKLPDID